MTTTQTKMRTTITVPRPKTKGDADNALDDSNYGNIIDTNDSTDEDEDKNKEKPAYADDDDDDDDNDGYSRKPNQSSFPPNHNYLKQQRHTPQHL